MKKIAVFCIPAHGHTNPILPVLTELVKRGNDVRFYSCEEFREKIEKTGATYIPIDSYFTEISEKEKENLKKVSVTEMTIQDINLTLSLHDFLQKEFESFRPDVVYSDSACFWGKLNAWKHNVPLVVSTSTFAFNRMSSTYMKNSPSELADLILGMPKCNRELNKLRAYGYKFKGLLSLVQSDNDTDSVVYTSKNFQPYSESFSDHYLFAGPSVFSDKAPEKDNAVPIVYISMGTVINDRPTFYRDCIDALKELNVHAIISCGNEVDITALGELPENVEVHPYVDQLDVLSRANVFITHCGMNSVSESLFMATPMVLYPQTHEQVAVARRAKEIGTGELLKDTSVPGIRNAVQNILNSSKYAEAAQKCSEDFRSCPGPAASAEFIEKAPHTSDGYDVMKELDKTTVRNSVICTAAASIAGLGLFKFVSKKFLWLYIIFSIIISGQINKKMMDASYHRIVDRHKK